MMADLEKLVSLQKYDLDIREREARLRHIPEEVAAREVEIATGKATLKAVQDRLAQSQKERRALERELDSIEERIAKYKDQLMQVKSNDEYRAMLKQIETAQAEKKAKEDEILKRMEEEEKLQAELKAREQELGLLETRIRRLQAELEAEASRLSSELDQRNLERQALLQTIPSHLLADYQQAARLRGGIALAEAKDGYCQICHVRLRPQVYSDIRLGETIIRCDNCDRIMYYLRALEEPAPEKPADPH